MHLNRAMLCIARLCHSTSSVCLAVCQSVYDAQVFFTARC